MCLIKLYETYIRVVYFAAFVGEYFKTSKEEESKDKMSFLEGYKSILNSKSNDESLVGN
jgi:hypothetical protein